MNVSIALGNGLGSSREALRQSLIGMLGLEGETREAAKEKIRTFETMEQYGIHLIEFILDLNYESSIRELASSTLKKHIETHWSSLAENFKPPETTLESKKKIKELLPLGLCDSNSKVRVAVAASICTIADWDWPENWPKLLDILVGCLNEDNKFSVRGALRILNELISEDLSKSQVQYSSSVILREMYRIFRSENRYSVARRSLSITIFTKMVATITSFELPELIEQYLQPLIPKFCKKFIDCLGIENDFKNNTYCSIKIEIISAIQMLITRIPKCVSDFLPQMLPPIWEILMESAKDYKENTVNGGNDINESIDFYVIIHTSEFLAHLITGPKGYDLKIPDYNLSDYHWFYLLDNYIPPEALQHLIDLLEISDEKIEVWNNNINQFIRDDDPNLFPLNIDIVRNAAKKLLIAIFDHPERAAANSLIVMILKELDAENTMRVNGNVRKNQTQWKSQEALLLTFCLAKNIIVERLKAETLHFDFVTFLKNVVLADLNDPESHPFLVGCCLSLCGMYVDQMPPELASCFLKATIKFLREKELSFTRLYAVKASAYWYHRDDSVKEYKKNSDILKSHLPAIFHELYELGCELLSWEIVKLVLQSFATFVSFDKTFASSMKDKICPLLSKAFVKFHEEYLVCSISETIFKKLTVNPECIESLQKHMVPELIRMITAVESKNKTKHSALDALSVLVKHSPQPLSSLLIETAFPACCTCILNIKNTWLTFICATKVIRSYLLVASQQVIDYRDKDDKTGPWYILQAVVHILNTEDGDILTSEDCEIMILLTKKAGNMLEENMDQLLTALLRKMHSTAANSSERRSFLIVFAHLMSVQFDKVFEFLTAAPGFLSQSALAFVIFDGFCTEYKFYLSSEDLQTVILALSKVLERGLTNSDSPLHKIIVQDDHIIPCETVSGQIIKPSPKGATSLLVEISRLITNYLSNCKEVEVK